MLWLWDELACLKWTFQTSYVHTKNLPPTGYYFIISRAFCSKFCLFSLQYWGLLLFSKLIMDNGLTKIVHQLFVLLHSATIAQLINRQSFGLTFCPLMFCFNRIFFQARFHFIIRISLYSVNNVHLIFCFKNYIFKHILIL